jgi:hypothetical protein
MATGVTGLNSKLPSGEDIVSLVIGAPSEGLKKLSRLRTIEPEAGLNFSSEGLSSVHRPNAVPNTQLIPDRIGIVKESHPDEVTIPKTRISFVQL